MYVYAYAYVSVRVSVCTRVHFRVGSPFCTLRNMREHRGFDKRLFRLRHDFEPRARVFLLPTTLANRRRREPMPPCRRGSPAEPGENVQQGKRPESKNTQFYLFQSFSY